MTCVACYFALRRSVNVLLPSLQKIGARLFAFVKENEFGNRIAAQTVAEMVFAVVRVSIRAVHSCILTVLTDFQCYPTKYFPIFFEYISNKLDKLLTDECLQSDEADNAVIWHLTLLSHTLRTNGPYIHPYHDRILAVFQCASTRLSIYDARLCR